MSIRIAAPALALAFAGFALAGPAHAQANVMKQCGEEYQAAKSANTLGGKNWNDYLKDCRVRHSGDAASAPAAQPAAAANPLKPAAKAATTTAPAAPTGPAVFPSKVDPKYSAEKPSKQRMKTCLDQYNANKTGTGNGGLKWIQKGGGYYSECNKRLKG
ncbi:MAG: hypothetical protein KDJ44_09360 [Rhodoblastus sp.]|nr:hypothetical protein [Rhodoblastus sp.]